MTLRAVPGGWVNVEVEVPRPFIHLSTGKVYGARYYTAEPVGGNWWEMETWCFDTFGNPGASIWNANGVPEPLQRWYMNNSKFWFRDEADRTWFVLRWS
jgi:hypothetical protein